MKLNELYNQLIEALEEDQLQLTMTMCEGTFAKVLPSLYEDEINLKACIINDFDQYIEINGRVALKWLYAPKSVGMTIRCYQREEDIFTQLDVKIEGETTVKALFHKLSSSKIARGAVYTYSRSVLNDLELTYPELTTTSDRLYSAYPFDIVSGILLRGEVWEDYSKFIVPTNKLKGTVNLKDDYSLFGDTQLDLQVPLISVDEPFLKQAELKLNLYSGLRDNQNKQSPRKLSGAHLVLKIETDSINTPMVFTLQLFDRKDIWQLSAVFNKGLALTEVSNQVFDLLQLNDFKLPPNTMIDFLKLHYISVSYNRTVPDNSYLESIKVLVRSTEAMTLPIPKVQLKDVHLYYERSAGIKEGVAAIWTTDIDGTIVIDLGSTTLALTATASMPQMDFSGHLIWSKDVLENIAPKVELSDMMTTFNTEAPANTSQFQLARVDIIASKLQRSFYMSAEINDLFQFTVGNFAIKMDQVVADGTLSPTERNASIYGLMSFGEMEKNNYFQLEARASYENGDWLFNGGLKLGAINIGQVLTQVFLLPKNVITSNILNIEVDTFKITFDSNGNSFSVLIGFMGHWKVLGQDIELESRMQLQRTSKDEVLYAAAMTKLKIGVFVILAQANDFYNRDLLSYLFRVQYKDLFLQAVYNHQVIKGDDKEILTVSMGGMTLGDLVSTMVEMVNPNARYQLPAPWNVINKIDLSRFQLVLNTTDTTAGFYYQVGLNIAGLMKIEKVGILNEKDKEGINRVRFALTGNFLNNTYDDDEPLTWDAIDEEPPQTMNQKTVQIHYLGLGQHLKNDLAKEAKTLEEGLNALKEQLKPVDGKGSPDQVQYDEDMNWLLGADFEVDGIRIGLLLNDPSLYGLMIRVSKRCRALEYFEGLYVELLYKKVTSDVGMFKAILLLPKKTRTLQLGAVTVKLGLVSFEVYSNGSFYVDLGFPHHVDFTNSFACEVGIYTGHGGLYIGSLKGVPSQAVPVVNNGVFSSVMLLGVGISFGLGRTFDCGIASGGVTLELLGIFEGTLAFFDYTNDQSEKDQALYYKAVATVGIVGRLYLTVDFKVISVSASALIRTYAQVTMEAGKKMLVDLDLSIKVKGSVKVLFARVKFSYNFHKHIEFKLGHEKDFPWQLTDSKALLAKGLVPRLYEYPLRPLFASKLLTIGRPVELVLSFLPFFSVENPIVKIQGKDNKASWTEKRLINNISDATTQKTPNHCVAFLPIMDKSNQKILIQLLSECIMNRWTGDTIDKDPDFKPDLADELTYKKLNAFLNENVTIRLDLDHKDAMEGAVFPLMPPLTLKWNKENTEEEEQFKVEYWKEPMVNSDYADLLTAYFKELIVDPTYEVRKKHIDAIKKEDVDNKDDGDKRSLVELVFLDYFQMATRALIGEIEGYFSEFKCVLGEKIYTVDEWKSILFNNPDLRFKKGILLFENYAYENNNKESLKAIATKLKMSYKDILIGCQKQTQLLEQKSLIAVPAYNFINSYQLPKSLIAALFYVRYHEFDLENNYQEYANSLLKLNPELSTTKEVEILGGQVLILPLKGHESRDDYILWQPLIGDSSERIGKMCYYADLTTGIDLEWDAFLSATISEGDKIIIPSQETLVDGDLTIELLLHRLYPDVESGQWIDSQLECVFAESILVAFMPVTLENLPYEITDANGQTLEEVLQHSGATIPMIADSLAKEMNLLDTSQEILLVDQDNLKKTDVMQQLLKLEENMILDMLSRFLLQGLRIPNPWHEDDQTKGLTMDSLSRAEMIPVFKAMEQQVPLDVADVSWVLECYGGQANCQWLDSTHRTKTYTQDEISPELPEQEIEEAIQSPIQLDDFVATNICYPVDTNLTIKSTKNTSYDTINILTKGMCQNLSVVKEALQGKTENSKEIQSKWGTYISLAISRSHISENCYNLYGANAQERLYLFDLLEKEVANVQVIYKPSQATGVGLGLVEEDWNLDKCIISKRNLSVETHMSPVYIMRDGGQSFEYSANLQMSNYKTFLRLLWECSVVGGGGYQITLENADGKGLPESIFSDDGKGEIQLLVTFDQYPVSCSGLNCTITQRCETLGSTITYYEALSEERLQYKPAFPLGCLGLRLEMEAPVSEDTSGGGEYQEERLTPDQRTKENFHIVGYQLAGNTDFNESHESIPLVPQGEDNSGFWHYEPVIPIYRYAIEDGASKSDADGLPYYAGLNKSGIVNFNLRDTLGNQAQIQGFSTDIDVSYNDLLIGIHEWPYQDLDYRIVGDSQEPMLRITFAPKLIENQEGKAALLDKLKYAHLQLMQDHVVVSVVSCFLSDAQILPIEDLRIYLQQVIGYVDQFVPQENKTKTSIPLPPPYVVNIPLLLVGQNYVKIPKGVFQLFSQLKVERTHFQTHVIKAREVISAIPPQHISIDPENQMDEVQSFVDDLEHAIPNLKIAQGGGHQDSLYGLSFGLVGTVQQLEITPYEFNARKKTSIKAPEYYALKPLKNQWMTRNCPITEMNTEGLMDRTPSSIKDIVYSNVDMEVWAIRYLEDVEEMLALTSKWLHDTEVKSLFDDCVAVKKSLAHTIANQVVALKEDGIKVLDSVKKSVEDKLKRSLSEGYAIDLIAQYRLKTQLANDIGGQKTYRMVVSEATEHTDATLQLGKIIVDNNTTEYTMFISSNSPHQSEIPPVVNSIIHEIEYDIEDNKGDGTSDYQSSKWLRLFNPIVGGNVEGVKLELSSDVPFPNVRKRCPQPPSIPKHDFVFDQVDPISIKNLAIRKKVQQLQIDAMLEWRYEVTCDYEFYEQDTLYLNIAFDCVSELQLRNESRDLFDDFAQYDYSRDTLLGWLRSEDLLSFKKGAKGFEELLQSINLTWEEWLSQSNLHMHQRLVERVYKCKITMHRKDNETTFDIIPLDGTETILKDMGASLPDVHYVNGSEDTLEIKVGISKLPLYTCHVAAPSIQVVRNVDVLKDFSINKDFIYRTEIVSRLNLEATSMHYGEQVIGAMPLKILTDYKAMVQHIWTLLKLEGVHLRMKLNVTYCYSLIKGNTKPIVRIPATLYLDIPADGSANDGIAKNLFDWFTEKQPSTNKAYYEFDVTVYAEDDRRLLLQTPHLIVEMEYSRAKELVKN